MTQCRQTISFYLGLRVPPHSNEHTLTKNGVVYGVHLLMADDAERD